MEEAADSDYLCVRKHYFLNRRDVLAAVVSVKLRTFDFPG